MRVIELTKGQTAIVDDADFDRIAQYQWQFDNGYASRRQWVAPKKFKKVYMHRFVIGDACEGKEVDHRNRNRLDNRRENLRVATRSQNAQNGTKMPSNKSGYKGVHWAKKNNKWCAQISVNKQMKTLGLFVNVEDAAAAYRQAAQQFHGEYANHGGN